MPDFITLTCPTCGGKLKLIDGVHMLVCASCGNEHMVHRDSGSIYLAPIAQAMRQIRVGTDKTAAELAVVRLTKEVQAVVDEVEAAKKRSYIYEVKPSAGLTYLPVAILVTLALFGIAANFQNEGLLVAMTITLTGLIVWYFVAYGQRARSAERLRDEDVDRLQNQYNVKRATLEKHHAIANS